MYHELLCIYTITSSRSELTPQHFYDNFQQINTLSTRKWNERKNKIRKILTFHRINSSYIPVPLQEKKILKEINNHTLIKLIMLCSVTHISKEKGDFSQLHMSVMLPQNKLNTELSSYEVWSSCCSDYEDSSLLGCDIV